MGKHIGDIAPDSTADLSTGKIGFHDWIGTGQVTGGHVIVPAAITDADAKPPFPQAQGEIRPYLFATLL